MNVKIITGSLLAVLMLMTLPSISAIEFNTIVEAKKSCLAEQGIDIGNIEEQIKDSLFLFKPRLFGRIRTLIRILILVVILSAAGVL